MIVFSTLTSNNSAISWNIRTKLNLSSSSIQPLPCILIFEAESPMVYLQRISARDHFFDGLLRHLRLTSRISDLNIHVLGAYSGVHYLLQKVFWRTQNCGFTSYRFLKTGGFFSLKLGFCDITCVREQITPRNLVGLYRTCVFEYELNLNIISRKLKKLCHFENKTLRSNKKKLAHLI